MLMRHVVHEIHVGTLHRHSVGPASTRFGEGKGKEEWVVPNPKSP